MQTCLNPAYRYLAGEWEAASRALLLAVIVVVSASSCTHGAAARDLALPPLVGCLPCWLSWWKTGQNQSFMVSNNLALAYSRDIKDTENHSALTNITRFRTTSLLNKVVHLLKNSKQTTNMCRTVLQVFIAVQGVSWAITLNRKLITFSMRSTCENRKNNKAQFDQKKKKRKKRKWIFAYLEELPSSATSETDRSWDSPLGSSCMSYAWTWAPALAPRSHIATEQRQNQLYYVCFEQGQQNCEEYNLFEGHTFM